MVAGSRLGLLRDRDFGRLFAGTAVSQLGDRVIFVALPLVAIVVLDAGELQVGLLTTATMAGSLLIGLPAGAWVERLRKRPVLINTDLTRAVVLLSIPVAWWAGGLTIWQLYAAALVHGVLTVFFDVAYTSYLPHLVGREKLMEANAKLSSVRSIASISGPGVAGPLVGWLGAPVALLVSTVGMAVSALFVSGIRKPESLPTPPETPRLWSEIKQGLSFVLGNPMLRATVMAEGWFNLCLVVYQTMLMVFLARQIGLGSFGIGLILSAMGCGGFLGAMIARRVAARVGQGPVMWLAPLVTGPLTAMMPLAAPGWSLYPAAACLALLSTGGVIRAVAQASLQQSLTPDHLLGRMSATTRFITWGSLPMGGLLGGLSGSLFGAATTLWIGAAGMTLAFLPTVLSPLRTMRELPTPAHTAAAAPAG